MKKVIAAVFVLFVLILAGCLQQPPQGGNGRVVFTIADKAADMGPVSSIMVTVDSVSAQSAEKGWVTVSSTPKTYDLIQLNRSGNQAMLADVQLEPGAYNQVRLQISKVLVVDAQGTHEAKLPSSELKIVGDLNVKANTTSAVTFDFIADESLHATGNGKYILAPVVRLQTREDANVNVKSETDVEINGGRQRTDTKVGMDEKGNVGVNVRLPANADINVDASGVITTGGAVNGASGNATGKPPRACTEEAKICPDGSAVGRQGPNCEFASCPPANYTFYGRITIGPLCPVEPCNRTFDYSQVRVNVYDAASKNRVAQVNADSSGYYGIKLEQGNYLVNVTDAEGNSFGLPRLDYTQSISIGKGQKIEMGFEIDTGIR